MQAKETSHKHIRNRSHIVHAGCWNTLSVQRAYKGTRAAPHAKGVLMYKVIAAELKDEDNLGDSV